jgi:hypothetical protein
MVELLIFEVTAYGTEKHIHFGWSPHESSILGGERVNEGPIATEVPLLVALVLGSSGLAKGPSLPTAVSAWLRQNTAVPPRSQRSWQAGVLRLRFKGNLGGGVSVGHET